MIANGRSALKAGHIFCGDHSPLRPGTCLSLIDLNDRSTQKPALAPPGRWMTHMGRNETFSLLDSRPKPLRRSSWIQDQSRKSDTRFC